MGRSIPSAQRIQQFARVLNSPNNGSHRSTQLKPIAKARPVSSTDPADSKPVSSQLRVKTLQMAVAEKSERMPLAEAVSECVKRWFQDTLREANKGDIAMQVLVGQMYSSGYGVAKDAQKGRSWITKASRSRASAWEVGNKVPGYNASDSDSDDANEDMEIK